MHKMENTNGTDKDLQKNAKADTNAAVVGPANFDTAMEAAGFGKFNLLLFLISIPATCATVFETTTMSYILPIAECDLQMTLFDKGILNAVTYAGMICSAIIWGYLADTRGRKKILVYGYLVDGICVLCSGLSQNFAMLATFKFLGGFIVNGPGAVLFTFMIEMHGLKQRSRVSMVIGVVSSAAQLCLSLLAWAIFPRPWEFVLFGCINVHSWQIFLIICGLPSIIAGVSLSFIPETPKFLMSQGRNAEALIVFQKIYAINTGKPRDSFPIKELFEEVPNRDSNANEHVLTLDNAAKAHLKHEPLSFTQSLRKGWEQINPMFHKPLLGQSLHVYTMLFCLLLGMNTIRLWLPQLFASIAEYEAVSAENSGTSNICKILEYSVNTSYSHATSSTAVNCDERKIVSFELYINNIIVAAVALLAYLLGGSIIKVIGQRGLLTLTLLISSACGFAMYWSVSGLTTLIISSIFIAVAGVGTSALMGIVVALFPTSLRTLIVSTSMMCGRLGALSGNLLFPVLMHAGCLPPFLMIGFIMLCACALSCVLPRAKKTSFT